MQKLTTLLFLLIIIGIMFFLNKPKIENQPFMIGAIADCQYADQPDRGLRKYRSCPQKLDQAVQHLNELHLEHIVHLGDFIDKDVQSFDTLLTITNQSNAPFIHTLGNHEFFVDENEKLTIPSKLGLQSRYYSFYVNNWRFIVVDGNDISLHAWPNSSEEYEENSRTYHEKFSDRESWNGAMGEEQIIWLEDQLEEADNLGENVVIYSHFPIYPSNRHNLWNDEDIMSRIVQHSSVKLWLNGHNHDGNYAEYNGVHFLTLKAMLDTDDTAYALLSFNETEISVQGFGRQQSMALRIR